MNPLIKWAGGKREQAENIGQLVLEHLGRRGTYYEPFAGGAAVALHLGLPRTVLTDINAELIAFYDAVRRKPKPVYTYAGFHCESHGKVYYYNVRRWDRGNRYERAARFWYLNKAGYNGMYRVNKSGGFNVPIGKKTPRLPPYADFLAFRRLTREWTLEACEYGRAIRRVRRGDVIYADPPYDGKFAYSTGFDADSQAFLAMSLHAAYLQGATVIASNADTPLVRQLYAWAGLQSLEERRRIAADTSCRQAAECVLILASH